MDRHHYAVILAGGTGTRLWPISRIGHPKQVQPFLDDQTLLQMTYRRLRRGFPASRIFVAANQDHAPLVRAQLQQLSPRQLWLEPLRRDTGPAIALAALRLLRRDPQAVLTTINSDAYVQQESRYLASIARSARAVRQRPDRLVLIGIAPTYPETGYGYIQLGRPVSGGLRQVSRFTEKPNLQTARRFLASGQYLWNPTLLTFRADTLLAMVREHLPRHFQILQRCWLALRPDGSGLISRVLFARLKPISIDYGVLECAQNLVVLPGRFGWADVGHWRTIANILGQNGQREIVRGQVVSVASQGNLLYAAPGRLLAAVGVQNLIVVDTPDALLVCSRDQAQRVREVVAALRGCLRRYR